MAELKEHQRAEPSEKKSADRKDETTAVVKERNLAVL